MSTSKRPARAWPERLPFLETVAARRTQSPASRVHRLEDVLDGVRFGYFRARCGLDSHYTMLAAAELAAAVRCRRCFPGGLHASD